MSIGFHDFLAWEAVATDAFLVRGAYVDIAGSFKSGALLGRMVYYYLPSKNSSRNKLRVKRKGVLWIAKTRDDWRQEIHLTGKELDRALKQLIDRGLVVKKTFHFAGKPTLHVRLNTDTFLDMLDSRLQEYKVEAVSLFTKDDEHTEQKHSDVQAVPETVGNDSASDVPRCPVCKSDDVVPESKGRCSFCLLRAGWKYYFPDKAQPRLGVDRYRTHSNKRWKNSHFRDNWKQALERAGKSATCRESSWFTFEFLIKNDINYTKMLDNWMSWRDESEYGQAPRHSDMEGFGQM